MFVAVSNPAAIPARERALLCQLFATSCAVGAPRPVVAVHVGNCGPPERGSQWGARADDVLGLITHRATSALSTTACCDSHDRRDLPFVGSPSTAPCALQAAALIRRSPHVPYNVIAVGSPVYED
ncbi:hypothetical protein GLOTRDRAFT_129997 [Gloeophyllum trabeum ATCC 11539]|uniref:Uncharacterized protein n=1 Tax=Gloeophyllum trabeum (strain ATCC 11539 / FP-39264 / Madison 617) TaxID=670483 RepID=S7RP98_GLOTA|nr:uncharacterized protein GLOTRDRAFT_129997 [Gloeophyllum trabeum ATCC 11539]EPQ54644.1 hypothetical protein GLOTRDRAFT_129997 [Gloeophyllum trabeum ATCC 11539]